VVKDEILSLLHNALFVLSTF
jgi:hypothetical protein